MTWKNSQTARNVANFLFLAGDARADIGVRSVPTCTVVELAWSETDEAFRAELDAFVDEQLGPLLANGSSRQRALLETLEAYLAAGGRKAQAARALHLERQSLYLRLHRIEELLGVSLDDEDAVLGLHLAIRALAFRKRRAAA